MDNIFLVRFVAKVRVHFSFTFSMSTKPVLAVDCDDVLCHYVPALLQWHNKEYHTTYALEDVKTFRLEDFWGGDAKQTVQKINAFSATEQYKRLLPIAGALQALHELKRKYTLVIVTARNFAKTAEATERWIEVHLPDLFSSIHYSSDKASVCKELNAVALIDDSVRNITSCAAVLPKVILFTNEDQYAWTKDAVLPNLNICRNWQEITTLLMSESRIISAR